ncbi:MAG: Sfum_1244 family protein [Granulosicoccaceae bacterium]
MSILSGPYLTTLCEDVQFNCTVSDARYARDYSLCIYLLRMREFYRWRFNIPLLHRLDTDIVGDWISDMEMHWDDIEGCEFKPIVIGGVTFGPFESDAINLQLQSSGLIYSAGYGRLGQPHFVLAELIDKKRDTSMVSYECGKELARDSITLPAMAQNQSVYIRHDSIKRYICQMVDEWRLQKPVGPLARVVEHYQLIDPNTFEDQIEKAGTQLGPLFLEHERGEVAAGALLGERYHQLLIKIAGSRGEFYLRAVRDMLADSLKTWPYILAQGNEIKLDFWLASVSGARLQLLRASGLATVLQADAAGSRFERLSGILEFEQQRWCSLAQSLLTYCEQNPDDIDIEAQCLSFFHVSQSASQ